METRRALAEALERQLEAYERYVPNPEILAEYLESTKQRLLRDLGQVFDEKINQLRQRG